MKQLFHYQITDSSVVGELSIRECTGISFNFLKKVMLLKVTEEAGLWTYCGLIYRFHGSGSSRSMVAAGKKLSWGSVE